MPHKRTRFWILEYVFVVLLLAAALLVRIPFMNGNERLVGDEIGYHKSAVQLIETGVYGYKPYDYSVRPNAFTTPGYPLFVAACYLVFGYRDHPPVMQIQWIQTILQLLSAVMLYGIARRMMGIPASLLVLGIFLFHPTFLFSPLLLLTEPLYFTVFISFIYLLIRFWEKKKTAALWGAALCFGASVMIRPAILPLGLIVIAMFVTEYRIAGWKRTLGCICVFACGFVCMMAPWWVRNVVTLHHFTPLASQGGNPLLWGAYPFEENPRVDIRMNPDDMARLAVQQIKRGFQHDPFLYLNWYTWGKTWYFIRKIWPGNYAMSQNQTILNLHYGMLSLGAAGLLLLAIRSKAAKAVRWMIPWTALLSFLVYLPFAPTPRYFYSALPFFMLGCGYVIERLILKMKTIIKPAS